MRYEHILRNAARKVTIRRKRERMARTKPHVADSKTSPTCEFLKLKHHPNSGGAFISIKQFCQANRSRRSRCKESRGKLKHLRFPWQLLLPHKALP